MFYATKIIKRMMGMSLLAILTFVALCFTGPTAAFAYASPLPVDLLSAGNFVILAETGITNTGDHACVIIGNIGNSPGTAAQMDGVWCSEITGTIYGVNAAYTGSGNTTCFAGNPGVPPVVPPDANKTLVDNAVLDMMTAYVDAAGRAPDATELGGGDISGMTLAPGVYKWSNNVLINTDVFLSGSASDVWIFEIAGDLNIASAGSVPAGIKVILSGSAQASNIFWQVGGPVGATLGTYSTFNGTILSAKQIIMQTGAVLNGRALAQTQVTLSANVVTGSFPAPPPTAPTLNKAFNLATINAGGTSTLTITLINADSTVATLTAPLIDTLPSGVLIASPANAGTTCLGSGVFIATSGENTVTLPIGRTIPANSFCTVTVNVTAAVGGNYINSLAAGALQTSNGNNAAPAVATLTVITPVVAPTLNKIFSPVIIAEGGVSTLTITLINADPTVATLTAPLVDTLPSGLLIAAPPAASTDCGGGTTVTAAAGGTTVTLPTGRSIPANDSCTVTVNVTAALGGNYINSLASGALQTTNGNNAAPAIATLTVITPAVAPTLGKAFSPVIIDEGGVSTLTITLINADPTYNANLISPLVDTLPSGVFIANPTNAGTTCPGSGSVAATIGGTTVTLPIGRTIPTNSSCTVTVDVTADIGGNYINSLASGALQTTNGNNAAPAVATLTVITPAVAPTLSKAFSPVIIAEGGVSTLTITLINAYSTVATLTAPLVDTLPSGVFIANPTNAGTTCPGSGSVAATIGGTTVTLPIGRTIPANSFCTVTVDVTADIGGNYINSLASGALQTSNGNNAAPAIATLTVITPAVSPTLSKAFSPVIINAGGVSTLTITLINADPTYNANLISPLVDTLPSGVFIANPTNAGTTCSGSGAVAASIGGTTVTLPVGRSIPANSFCTVTVSVTAPVGGNYINTLASNALQTTNGNNAAQAIATLTVITPVVAPTLNKAFSPVIIAEGGVSTLTITLINVNPTAASLISPLVDTLPSGVFIANPTNAGTTCPGSGAVAASIGGTTVTLPVGRSIPANSSCTVTVSVTAPIAGSYFNTLASNALQTSNGNNTAPAIATLTVTFPLRPTLTKAFSSAIIVPGRGGNVSGVSTLTITLINPSSTVATLTTALTDTLPAGVVISKPLTASTTCGGGTSVIATAKGTTVTLPAGRSIPANGSCTVTVRVTALCTGTYVNTLPADALQTSNGNNALPASATLTVTVAPTLSKAFKKSKIKAGQVSTLTITLINPNSTAATLIAALTDTLPGNVVIAATPNASTTCTGIGVVTTGVNTVTLPVGRSIPASSSCTVTVNVTGSVRGIYYNTLSSGALRTDQGNNASSASATLTVK